MNSIQTDRFFLRHLAGRYFLVRKDQVYPDYVKPVEMDETGARFWEALCGGQDRAAGILAEEFGICAEQADADLKEYMQRIIQAT